MRDVFYLTRYERLVNGNRKTVCIHQDISERILGRKLTRNDRVDHRDGDGLNNSRENVRVVTNALNMQNRIGLSSNNKSGYRGVSWESKKRKWRAGATVSGVYKHIGLFDTPEEAARAAVAWRIENMPGVIRGNDVI
jgi:hypothetical protein